MINNIEFSFSPWLIPVCFAAAGFLAWWMYRKLPVELSRSLRLVLGVMRFLTLFLALLLLLEPILTAITEERTPPVIALLHDDSESMLAHKDSAFVRQKLPGLVEALKQELAAGDVVVRPYMFGGELDRTSESSDQPEYKRPATDVSRALEETAEQYANQNLGGVICITDGIYTQGKNPVNALGNINVPVFTALAGDTAQPRDLVIESVLHNDVSYLNTETPVQVNVRALGAGDRQVEVRLANRGRQLATQVVNLTAAGNVGTANFNIKLTEPGIQQFEVHISEIDNEISYKNNHQLFFIKVLETRLNIALIASAPHPDLGALRKALLKDDRYRVSSYIRKTQAQFYPVENELAWDKYDLFILHNFPATANDKETLDKVYAQVKARKAPVMYFAGSETRFNIHPEQKQHMALFPESASQRTTEARLNIAQEYKDHATFRFEEDQKFLQWLSTAPPLLRNDSRWKAQAGAKVYGTAEIKGIALDYPIFALQENNDLKNMVFVGENLWRYRMHNYVLFEDFELYDGWLYNLIQWLTTKTDRRKFRVYPTKNLYSGDERVIFKGQVFDDAYNAVSGAEIKLVLTDPEGKTYDYFMEEAQKGNYIEDLSNLEEGAYTYEAVGKKGGRELGRDRGEFSVGRSAIEYATLKANDDVLKQVALRTGGAFVYARDLEKLANVVLNSPGVKPVLDVRKSTQSLQKFFWPIVLLLLLLFIEWTLRKRSGLL